MANVYSFQGFRPVVHPTAFVHPTAVLIGDVRIGPGCYIGPGAALRGDFSAIVLGFGCNVQDNVVMHGRPEDELVVEDDGHIGHAAVLHGCRIGRNALIGIGATVFDGAVVGQSAIVASMSFVKARFEVPARHLVAGIPARVVRELSDHDIAEKRRGTVAYQRLAMRCFETMQACEPLTEVEPGRQKIDVSNFWPSGPME